MTIILVRHGETDLNRARILQPPDTPLSDLGQRQATAVAERLKTLSINAILSSDMTRAAQTASAISRSQDIQIEFSTLLHERNFGDLRGTPYSDLNVDPMADGYHPPNGESWPQFRSRVAEAFKFMVEFADQQTGTVAVVSHGLVIREIVDRHLQLHSDVPQHVENTSITVFDSLAPYKTSAIADHQHIEPLMNEAGRKTNSGGQA